MAARYPMIVLTASGSVGIPRTISPCAIAELRTRRSTAKVREDSDHSHDEVQSQAK
jgi:hypothetical protein